MKIYGIYMDRPLSQEENERFMSFISPEKREKCRRFYHKEDAHRTLLGDVLVRSVISRQYQLDKSDIRFSTQEYGKPCIPDLPDAHFNISHSGRWVICAFDSQPIGIDIEKTKPISLEIAKRFFSKTEYSDLLAKDKEADRLFLSSMVNERKLYQTRKAKAYRFRLIPFQCACTRTDKYPLSFRTAIPHAISKRMRSIPATKWLYAPYTLISPRISKWSRTKSFYKWLINSLTPRSISSVFTLEILIFNRFSFG